MPKLTATMSPAVVTLDASGASHRDLNVNIREAVATGARHIQIRNVCGQRYIGTDIPGPIEIELFGTPGNDLGVFLSGPHIVVRGNAQDGCGNTMNSGDIVVHGHAGDVVGLSARGGKMFIRDGVGYRAGIHMKEYQDKKPEIVIGGTAQDFLGEYMAGGVLLVLGLNLKDGEKYVSDYVGTGMHGGVIYLRGEIDSYHVGKEVGISELNDGDHGTVARLVQEYAAHFGQDARSILDGRRFIKLFPLYLRPYGTMYAP